MGRVRLMCGTARSRRAEVLDSLAHEYWGRVRLLLPTRQYATRRLEQLLRERGLAGAWGRPVLTMDGLATEIMLAEGRTPTRVQDHERRLLMSQAIAKHAQDPALLALGAAAKTQGFATHVLRVIVQLKQAGIEPHTFIERVHKRERRSSIDNAVCVLYSAYQQALLEANLYDLPGLFWGAEAICLRTAPRALRNVDAVLLDGFDDFTPSEFRLLASLAPHVDLLGFGINYDPDASRKDLYSITERTARRIVDHFDTMRADCEEGPPESQTEFAARHLFWRDPPPIPRDLRANLELAECPSPTLEIEYIARRIKGLLLEGASADSIALVFRTLGKADDVVRSVFAEAGIPLRMTQNAPLSTSAIAAFLLTFFDAVAAWDRETVIDVLASPWLAWRHDHAGAFRLVARTAQIIGGFKEWQKGLTGLSARLDARSESLSRTVKRMPRFREAIAGLSEGVACLATLNAALPAKATLGTWASATERLWEGLGVSQTLAAPPEDLHPSIVAHEAAAWTALRELMASYRVKDDERPLTLTRDEFVSHMRQLFAEASFHVPQPACGVSCLDAATARHLRFDYVFFAGVVEGEVPRPPAFSAIYGDEDIEDLEKNAGIALDDKRAHGDREALLFHHMLGVARQGLFITWSKSSRDGKDCYASPYVRDLRRLFPAAPLRLDTPPADSFAPGVADAASPRELRNTAFHLETGPCRDLFPRANTGASLEARRQGGQTITAYDGVLLSSDVAEAFALDFGPRHLFSANQIEEYTACPFQFFVTRVLNLDMTEIPEAEFDRMLSGGILHGVLHRFHRAFVGRGIPEIPESEARAAMHEALDAVFAAKAWKSASAPKGVVHVEKLRLAAQLDRYLSIEREKDDAEWKPTHFEVGFGRAPGDEVLPSDDLSRSEPYVLDTDEGPVSFSGRIDRMDVDLDAVRLVDYKMGSLPEAGAIASGDSIQLGLYALAVEALLLPGHEAREAVFLAVGKTTRREALERTKDKWPERRQALLNAVTNAVRGIRAGRFAPLPKKKACQFCALARLAPGKACRCEAYAEVAPEEGDAP